jgi:hypothetical protein
MKVVRYLALLFLLGLRADVFAQEATVTYVDGWVDIKNKSGDLVEAWEGDLLYIGESVITDEASYAELEKEQRAAVIKIAPDTVFTIGEVEEKGNKRTVLSATLGSVAYKFNRTLSGGPRISTPSIIAGVRGTEFTVFAGVDGSSLLAVESGEVDVTSEGETVRLLPKEGVEVRPGEKPGEKFQVLRGQIDYSTWNRQRFNAFLDDPVGTILALSKKLDDYIEEIETILPLLRENQEKLEAGRTKLQQLEKEEGKEARYEYYKETVFPLEVETSYLGMNRRYYALSALSMRRFLIGKIYMEMKTRYITDRNDHLYEEFLAAYESFLSDFEKYIVPHLIEADI